MTCHVAPVSSPRLAGSLARAPCPYFALFDRSPFRSQWRSPVANSVSLRLPGSHHPVLLAAWAGLSLSRLRVRLPRALGILLGLCCYWGSILRFLLDITFDPLFLLSNLGTLLTVFFFMFYVCSRARHRPRFAAVGTKGTLNNYSCKPQTRPPIWSLRSRAVDRRRCMLSRGATSYRRLADPRALPTTVGTAHFISGSHHHNPLWHEPHNTSGGGRRAGYRSW